MLNFKKAAVLISIQQLSQAMQKSLFCCDMIVCVKLAADACQQCNLV